MCSRHVVRVAVAALSLLTALSARPALAVCDTAAPVLTAFTIVPSSVNTTAAAQIVTCNMTFTDNLSGVTSAQCGFTPPGANYEEVCDATAPSSGTSLNGVWSCSINIPRYAPAGIWAADVSAVDAVGNQALVDLPSLGFPSMLSVTSDPDTVAPAMSALTLVPNAVNVSAASQNVTCNMTVSDAKSGVSYAACDVVAPGSVGQDAFCFATTPTSGTRNNGVFSCVVTVPRYSHAGTWTTRAGISDQAGNLVPAASTTTLAVTSSPEDITAPSLSSFDFNPKIIDVGAAAKPVVCTMGVSDSPAGVNTATCTLNISTVDPNPPFDFVTQTESCTATGPLTGTRNSGTFQCTVNMPRYSAGGVWSSDVSLEDLATNSGDYPQALTLNVACSPSDPETTCSFAANHQTLSWNAIAGATQYNVYRGPLTNLVDTNADHLPDAGYGTCQNSRDAVLTDTSFVDTDVPTAGQKGFFYLVSYKSGGVEKGLGTNSFGNARTELSPCP